ncbi:MAG: hypothetical protein KGD58_05090 [Candidatus Lokiarchaeota archaeon]|nr:hypothetical protein [Candidatus Lokiarchaeota archaeon]
MITREFYIKQLELRYFVAINQFNLDLNHLLERNKITSEEKVLDHLFKTLQEIQDNNKESVIQIICDKFILNQDHIYIACYYMQKAFFRKTNISNTKNIELMLYLSTYRQISKAIETVGINSHDLKAGNIIICIISPIDNTPKINEEILQILNANETELTLNNMTSEKIKKIIENYNILDSQIKPVLNSYLNKEKSKNDVDNEVEILSSAVFDLICEKMALLNLEKIKSR